jgi:hypothetical protein
MKTTIEFYQTGGAEETLEAAKATVLKDNPGAMILNAIFKGAFPRDDGGGRWVTIEVGYQEPNIIV